MKSLKVLSNFSKISPNTTGLDNYFAIAIPNPKLQVGMTEQEMSSKQQNTSISTNYGSISMPSWNRIDSSYKYMPVPGKITIPDIKDFWLGEIIGD